MVITPHVDASGSKVYASGPVSTTVNGRERIVNAEGYSGASVGEVVAQAYGNAQVVQWRARLARKYSVL